MNLLIKILYLFLIIVSGKTIIPLYIENTIYQNLTMILLLYLSNIFYRIGVNYYFNKTDTIYNITVEGVYRSVLVIVGIVMVNYFISNPEILNQYNIEVPSTNIYTSSAVSLIPFLMTKSLLSPDV
ncbi:hypothetical protein crov365 [Cafeteria roenbergensis virus]|uniref:Uncharacterized protein n=1 Tax=Cafeteria roenbergensis virus (strain BV-PW1) TaxID=693272 RepID=E3T5D6_CROVB|nr:hypothetical protein crov365 [Cafeteria roenbergensis virus BV-PW1]ADO67399.1 hypothetical protein crov365 [Cafeteria roenbergensis virus BV-PW1]